MVFPVPKHLGPKVKDLLKRIASDTTGGLVEDEKPLMESGDLTPSGPHTWGILLPSYAYSYDGHFDGTYMGKYGNIK